MQAIQAKLHGVAKDENFLKNLIYSGALDICIDGLNEVSADTRASITQFVEEYFKGNILMTTQPIEWTPPATATKYVLQPLKQDQIETFLVNRYDMFQNTITTSIDEYEKICRTYLVNALDSKHPKEIFDSTQRILSNPMDATIVAQMLAHGGTPDLFHLEEQQYQIMAEDYERVHIGKRFPLHEFSERIYQMRLKDKITIPEETFTDELLCMERYKMVLNRQVAGNGTGSVYLKRKISGQ
jgi:lysophospholipase L1-like esterase